MLILSGFKDILNYALLTITILSMFEGLCVCVCVCVFVGADGVWAEGRYLMA